ncbi:histone deacetylase 11 [Musca autumnalis]|uniref:histone deacetylase 11 n=1 Tax=Musca autumnalis TaxID=221902 RepID=UPI003CEE92F7
MLRIATIIHVSKKMQKLTEKVHSEKEEEPEVVWIKRVEEEPRKFPKTEDESIPQLPIVYSNNYGVHFAKLEKLHPFDAQKGKNIQELLIKYKLMQGKFYEPTEISKEELLEVHKDKYLRSLKWSFNVAQIAEIPFLIFVPNCWVQCGYLRPMRFQTAGSIMAGKLALEYGWAINLGGGFHHCCSYKGGGFCPYADITLMIQRIFSEEEEHHINKVMIIDLDAHQGNGHERDFMDNSRVYIMDMYNYLIYPKDHEAKLAIRRAVELKPRTENREYLTKMKRTLKHAMKEFKPQLVVYNAGTDILEGDPLGNLSITPEGVIERDQYVFGTCRARGIPIVMLLSGGYLKASAKVIADSIMNLKQNGLLQTIR